MIIPIWDVSRLPRLVHDWVGYDWVKTGLVGSGLGEDRSVGVRTGWVMTGREQVWWSQDWSEL